jgi:hypothetical protein
MFLAINASITAAATGLLFTKEHMLCERGSYDAVEVQMLSTLLIVLLVLWLLGVVTSYTMGGFIHILLIVAIVVVLIRVIQGRNPLAG